RALKLAVDATNEDPAKKPWERRVNVIHTGTGETLEELQAQAVRLAVVDRVFALIGGDTAAPGERSGEAAGGSTPAITPRRWGGASTNQALFTVGVAPAEQGRCLAQHAAGRKLANVVILTDESSPVHRAIAEAFTRKLGTEVTQLSLPHRPASADKERDRDAE